MLEKEYSRRLTAFEHDRIGVNAHCDFDSVAIDEDKSAFSQLVTD